MNKMAFVLVELLMVFSLATCGSASSSSPSTSENPATVDSAASGLRESGELLRKAAGNGNWLEGRRFSSGVKEEEIQPWIEGLGL
ncbi:hypothetical protein Dpep_1053 [Dethiosulfovibrio peptidovorans DSM 11002]|uniref:Lipoprotein n=1 Tax=Dethiosulfovibrio peptidovorans DSM 11002 TaxID=469381 RepID=D2Z6I2_9BACT|nr:hypothetical protein [Dethiosulfovibrio peptidovorans]EFC91079.1 hypothetical protein Dpep_1053 [Dethiosulfovibrio peptidovorans DSM 11002]